MLSTPYKIKKTDTKGFMNEKAMKSNIVLIGMAGAGKSTVGVELADLLGLRFADVDTLIEAEQGAPLQQLLGDLGVQDFRQLEENTLLSLDYSQYVLATGGSAVYSEAGMKHLKDSSVLVLLDVSLDILKQRVGDFSSRGLVKSATQSFDELFLERQALYSRHADCVIACSNRSVTEICKSIQAGLSETFYHF